MKLSTSPLAQFWRITEDGFLEVMTTPKSDPNAPPVLFTFTEARIIESLEDSVYRYNWPEVPNIRPDMTGWANLKNFFADMAEKMETLLLELTDE